jgi:ABC-type spermidine/putrescine transport system permease subunit II
MSWLDYGLTTVVGGGRVQTLTMRLFSQIREGGVSQAAASSLLLTVPALVALLLLRWRDGWAVMTTGGPGLMGGLQRGRERKP